jgi:subtilisin
MSGRDSVGTDPDAPSSADDRAVDTSLARRDVLKGLAGAGAVASGVAGADRVAGLTGGRRGRYVVGVDPGHEAAAEAHAQAQSTALRLHREIDLGDVRQVVAGWYTREQRERLRRHPAVAYVEPEQFLEPHRPTLSDPEPTGHGGYPWGIERIGADAAHADGYTGDGADVVIVDTGSDPEHQSLSANVGVGGAFGDGDCVETERQFATVDCNAVWDDDQYHGTHVGGTAAAVDRALDDDANPSVDVDRVAGVAPEATIHVANVFEWFEDGDEWVPLAPSSNTADAIRWTADQGYDVVNASLGGPNPTTVIEDALAYAVGQHDVVFVSSAGNDGEVCDQDPHNDDPDDCVGYPAAFADALAVGNTERDDTVNPTSSRGPEVGVAAPGTAVLSAIPAHLKRESDIVDGDHWWLTGTSMASPHVAGLAALLTAHTDLQGSNEIRTRIRESATDVGARDVESGAGLIDAATALDGSTAPLSVATLQPSSVGQSGATLEGELLDLGGADTVAVSFEYWPEGSDETRETLAKTVSEPGSVEIPVDDLEAGTTYEFRALAETDQESAEGEPSTFTTEFPPLAVETGAASGVGKREATLAGEVTELGGADEGEASFEYWVGGSEPSGETARETLTAAGPFERTVTGLEPGTTYVFRAVAETETESAVGGTASFRTEYLPLTVETGEATAVGHTSATVTADLVELGANDTATVSVEYWASEGNDSQETEFRALSEAGTVEVELTGLRQDTAYGFRAVADSGTETDAGDTEAFATPIEDISRPTVDRTEADSATFSRWGDGYRIRAAGTSPWQRPRDHHGYGAVYGEVQGDVVVQTTLAGFRGDHDLRTAGLMVTDDVLGGGGVAGDLLLAAEPGTGLSLAVYDDDSREYETVTAASPSLDDPLDLRVTKRDSEFVAEYRRPVDASWQLIGSVTVPAAGFTQHAGVFATGGHDTDRCVADFSEFLIGETGVALLPAAPTLPLDVEMTLDLVVENADRGIRSYAATVEVADTDPLTIEDVRLAGDPVYQSVNVRPDGGRATIEAGMGESGLEGGDVRIATLTVRTRGEGTAPVDVPEVTVVDDATTVPYDVVSVDGADVTVAEGVGPPPVVGTDRPKDLDGDGLYRDVTGDGQFTVADVQAFFEHRHEDVVLNNAEYFNFAGSDPPEVSIADVQVLFEELVASDPEVTAALGFDVDDPEDVADLSAADLARVLESDDAE